MPPKYAEEAKEFSGHQYSDQSFGATICIPPRYVLERVHSANYLNLVVMATLLALVAIVL